MRTTVMTQNVTPDGATEMLDDGFDPSGEPDPDGLTPTHRQDQDADACLFDRRTPEGLRSHWPLQSHDTTGTPPRSSGCSTRDRSGPGSPTPHTSPPGGGAQEDMP